ncbi:ERAD-associated E3 ubiquitin-protein ligase HRD1 [Nakaseomyces bracarensis]|uniref:RING-type E3 ubiquitin transferase n=1 Tax=Nakaseomyces bracarensis TaxID=273131 RepID=A0ABR4NT72_9SACH
MLSATQRKQLLVFTGAVYVLTVYCVLMAFQSSVSYLQIALKLSEGFNILIITVFTLLNSAILWQGLTSLLFGELRLIEHEHIFERLPYAVIGTIFMFSTFNERYFFTLATCALVLLYMKVFHWILRDRLDLLVQGINEHTTWKDLVLNRYICNLILLVSIDVYVISFCISKSYVIASSVFMSAAKPILGGGSNITQRALIYIMQAMEFTNLLIDLMNLAMNTGLQYYEFYLSHKHSQNVAFNHVPGEDAETENEEDDDTQFNGLEGKFMYEKLIDVITRFLQTLVHIVMALVLNLPLMLLKDIFVDIYVLYDSSKSLVAIWRNSKQLDTKLPTMTPEDLADDPNFDNVCIVCMDDLLPGDGHRLPSNANKKPKKLPCGHILHLSCLKNWMERSQTCPICRLPVFNEKGEILTPSSNNNSQTNLNQESSEDRAESNIGEYDEAELEGYNIPRPTSNVNTISLNSNYPFTVRKRNAEQIEHQTATETTDLDNKEILDFELLDSTTGDTIPAQLTLRKKTTTNVVYIPESAMIHRND